jgi:N-acyl-D-aspartate/D-glutamate deacylase
MTDVGSMRIRAGRLIDGTGAEPQENVTVTVAQGMITQVERGGAADGDALDLCE